MSAAEAMVFLVSEEKEVGFFFLSSLSKVNFFHFFLFASARSKEERHRSPSNGTPSPRSCTQHTPLDSLSSGVLAMILARASPLRLAGPVRSVKPRVFSSSSAARDDDADAAAAFAVARQRRRQILRRPAGCSRYALIALFLSLDVLN